MKKGSSVRAPAPDNIVKSTFLNSAVSSQIFQGGECDNENSILVIHSLDKLTNLLDAVCSENPQDPEKNLGWMTATIELTDPTKVIKAKPMQYTPDNREHFAKAIKEMLEQDLIKESRSPHMAPAFLVGKKDGSKRMVIDYRRMNLATKGDSYMLPVQKEIFQLLQGKKIFSVFVCKSRFYQIRITDQVGELTAFTCPQGHY